MQKFVLGLFFAALFFTSGAAENVEGKNIFEVKGCVMCHKKDVDTIGPSLHTIAISYSGKESMMIPYLQGQGSPIVDPSRASVMDPQLLKIRSMFEEDIRALAEYIIASADRPF